MDKELYINFIKDFPLNKKLYSEKEIYPTFFQELRFDYYCLFENKERTFDLNGYMGNEPASTDFGRSGGKVIIGRDPNSKIDVELEKRRELQEIKRKKSIHKINVFEAICTSCQEQKIHIVLNIAFDFDRDTKDKKYMKCFVRKIGQFPLLMSRPDNDVSKYISKEDEDLYQKGLNCLASEYGIGAFAYFRRIVENNILKIVQDLRDLDQESKSDFDELLAKFKIDKSTSKLLQGIKNYLPSTINRKGEGNILEKLWFDLSDGIHNLTDEEIFERASDINYLLKYLVKEINKEKIEGNNLKEILKKSNH